MNGQVAELSTGRPTRPALSCEAIAQGFDRIIEEAILGSLLMRPKSTSAVLEVLCPQDFLLPSHQAIFETIRDLHGEGVPVDPFTVGDRLSRVTEFEARGGRDYLLVLCGLPTTAYDTLHQADILKRQSLDRQARNLASRFLDGGLDLVELHDGCEQLVEASAPNTSHILTVGQLFEEAPSEPAWVVKHLLARETITDLSAKIKVGKTHFALDLVACLVSGRDFLGLPTAPTAVLYLSEERRSTFASACKRVGIGSNDGLHILLRSQAPRDWASTGSLVLREAKRLGVGLVVCDTLSDWASLEADMENDAGAALAAMRPLQAIAAAGLAVLTLRHERKSGGEVGESGRGSSAFGGAADILLSLKKDSAKGHENRRVLEAVGRLDGTPPKTILEMTDGRYRCLGTSGQVEAANARKLLLSLLALNQDEALSEKQLLEQAGGEIARSTLKRVMDELVGEGALLRAKGAGSAPPRAYGYWLSEEARL